MSDTRYAKAGLDRDKIRAVIDRFYVAVREDPRLGPIFHAHVGTQAADWAAHLDKIEDFWANVMLRERSYDGNPMRTHMAVPEIESQDFARWLEIFDRTAAEVLPEPQARAFQIIAHRIGRSLRIGLERIGHSAPPSLAR